MNRHDVRLWWVAEGRDVGVPAKDAEDERKARWLFAEHLTAGAPPEAAVKLALGIETAPAGLDAKERARWEAVCAAVWTDERLRATARKWLNDEVVQRYLQGQAASAELLMRGAAGAVVKTLLEAATSKEVPWQTRITAAKALAAMQEMGKDRTAHEKALTEEIKARSRKALEEAAAREARLSAGGEGTASGPPSEEKPEPPAGKRASRDGVN